MALIESILTALFPPQAERVCELMPGRRATVFGRVVPRDVLASPFTGERCVWYRATVREWRRSVVDGSGGFWVTVSDEEAIAEFYLQDESGRAIVHPERAAVSLGRAGRAERVPMSRGLMDRQAAESRLLPGDWVEVSGLVENVDDLFDEARDYRQSASRVLLGAPDGGVIRIRLVARG